LRDALFPFQAVAALDALGGHEVPPSALADAELDAFRDEIALPDGNPIARAKPGTFSQPVLSLDFAFSHAA
jgi:hypothetical protein